MIAASCSGAGEPSSNVAASPDSGPALIEAAAAGRTEQVRGLLDDGASVDFTDESGRTPLIAASYGAHIDTAEVLIAAGSDVNRQDHTQQSAYLIATSEIGPDAGLELLQLTLANGADVGSLDSYNGTGLIRAADRGYPGIVSELLQTEIEIDHVNRLQWTALLESIILGDGGPDYTEIVDMLLRAGADPNLADGQGVTPLAHAQSRSFDEIARLLVASGGSR
jgi:uncharacterized protein